MISRILKRFSKIFPLALIVISMLGLLFGGVILSRWDYSVRGLVVAVPSIIASLFLIYMIRVQYNSYDENYIIFKNYLSHTTVIFIFLYLVSIIILLANLPRLFYFVTISALYILIFFQVFSANNGSARILFEIIFVMSNIIFSTTLGYPFFFRTGDILRHIFLSTVTLLSGHTIPADLDPNYVTFPLYHIFIAISSSIIGLPIQTTIFIVLCPVYVITIIFLYKIFQKISHNEQISLLACLCFSANPIVLTRGIEMITSVAAFVGFVILLYLIFTFQQENSIKYKGLIFLVTIFIILVHQVSILQILLLISIFILCELTLSKKRYFFSGILLFIILPFISYWVYTSESFLDWFIIARVNLNYFDIGTKISQTSIMNPMELAILYVQNNLYLSIFIFFALIGIGYILYLQKPQYFSVVALFTLVVLILYIPNPLFTSDTLSRMYRIDRFWILLSPFMALAMASGIYWVNKLNQSRNRVAFGVITIIFTIFVVFSLQNPVMEITSKEGRLYFTEEELRAFNFVSEKIPYGLEIFSDSEASKFVKKNYFSLTKDLNLPFYEVSELKNMRWIPTFNQYIIFRDAKYQDGKLIFFGEDENSRIDYISNQQNRKDVKFFNERNSIIYRTDQVTIIKGNQ